MIYARGEQNPAKHRTASFRKRSAEHGQTIHRGSLVRGDRSIRSHRNTGKGYGCKRSDNGNHDAQVHEGRQGERPFRGIFVRNQRGGNQADGRHAENCSDSKRFVKSKTIDQAGE